MRDHPNPKIQAFIDQARANGSSEKVIALMMPYWISTTPSIEDQVRERMLAPPLRDGPPPLESGTLEQHVRHRRGLPPVERANE